MMLIIEVKRRKVPRKGDNIETFIFFGIVYSFNFKWEQKTILMLHKGKEGKKVSEKKSTKAWRYQLERISDIEKKMKALGMV